MNVYFEHCGQFITAAHDDGEVVIRCNFNLTDCKETENLDAFVQRHGGPVETSRYLRDCYANK